MKLMNNLPVLLLSFLVMSCSMKTSEETFTKEVYKSLQNQEGINNVKIIDSLHIQYTINEVVGNVYLQNAYAEIKMGNNKTDVINKYVNYSLLITKQVDFSAGKIFVNIKSLRWVKETENRILIFAKENSISDITNDQFPYYELLAGDLVAVYSIEDDNTIRYITIKQFSEMHLDKNTLRDLAILNLMNQGNKVQVNVDHGIVNIKYDGIHESSLILVDTVTNDLVNKVGNNFIFAIPSRDLFVGISNETISTNLESIQNFTKENSKDNKYSVSDKLYIYNNGQITEYK